MDQSGAATGRAGPLVERLARRIASFSPEAIALAKRSVEASALPIREGLLEEAWCFQQTLAIPSTREKLAAFMQGGGQTREVELNLGSSTALAADPGPREPVR